MKFGIFTGININLSRNNLKKEFRDFTRKPLVQYLSIIETIENNIYTLCSKEPNPKYALSSLAFDNDLKLFPKEVYTAIYNKYFSLLPNNTSVQNPHTKDSER